MPRTQEPLVCLADKHRPFHADRHSASSDFALAQRIERAAGGIVQRNVSAFTILALGDREIIAGQIDAIQSSRTNCSLDRIPVFSAITNSSMCSGKW